MSIPQRSQKQEDIFEQDQSIEQSGQIEGQPQEGQILSGYEQEQQDVSSKQPQQVLQQAGQNVYDSSEEDADRLETLKRKRQLMWRQRQQEQQKTAGFTQQELLRKAFEDLQKTNKRVMLMRKKNIKRMQDIEKVRMTQQNYLTSTNTHFRGSVGEYPLITSDKSGRTLFHPNYSLRVNDMKLGDFIQKNIKQESTANYLNQVVKFQNYAYQQRKKRRQNIEC